MMEKSKESALQEYQKPTLRVYGSVYSYTALGCTNPGLDSWGGSSSGLGGGAEGKDCVF